MATNELQSLVAKATEHQKNKQFVEAIQVLNIAIEKKVDLNEATIKAKEDAILLAGNIHVELKSSQNIVSLLKSIRPLLVELPKAKIIKIVRHLLEDVSLIQGSDQVIIDLCKEYISWAEEQNVPVLKQKLEAKLAAGLFKIKDYTPALNIISKLLREVKRLDDKPLLVELYLLESKIHHGLSHLPKSRAALTAARTNANAIYCPPLLQGELDVQSGTLHCDEKDYKTAYSYFYEAFENYTQMEDVRGIQCLKYMLLCKVMTNIPEDVHALISGKLALRYAGTEMEAMRAIASAHAVSSLKQFQEAIHHYKSELREDPLIHRHLNELYDTLLEHNLARIIEPFSQVQISHVAELMELPVTNVEKKLSQMILDKKLVGILDQGNNCLIIFDDPETDGTYKSGLETITHIGRVVNSLYNKAGKLS